MDPDLVDKSCLVPHGDYPRITKRRTVTPEQAKTELGIEPSASVVLVFGTIKPNKRLDLAIDAVAKVRQSVPEITLVVAGKPQDQDVSEYIDQARKLGLASNVLWRLGHVTDDELVRYFTAADVVLFPYQWIYQSGALVMAMSFGRPVIATEVGGNAEYIRNNETGILVQLDNPDAWVSALDLILRNKDVASAMGQAACDYATHELSWDSVARLTLKFYRQVERS
jgi:glycosyltransferase involved in cell wall biosynthesis